ncbi:unnamed protein product [Urochloa humidicola]
MANGSVSNISELRMVVHSGTHVDAPGHMVQEYFEAGLGVDKLDLDVLNGEYARWSAQRFKINSGFHRSYLLLTLVFRSPYRNRMQEYRRDSVGIDKYSDHKKFLQSKQV